MQDPAYTYNEDEKNRLWTHRLHEDLILYERHSFVLVTESLLLVACAQLLTAHEHFAASALATVGILVTSAWLMVNRRQRKIITHVHERAMKALPEFADTYRDRKPARLSSTVVLATVIPILLGAIWTVLLVVAL
jgi:hypothetical protein